MGWTAFFSPNFSRQAIGEWRAEKWAATAGWFCGCNTFLEKRQRAERVV
jgi:hypothetical protein